MARAASTTSPLVQEQPDARDDAALRQRGRSGRRSRSSAARQLARRPAAVASSTCVTTSFISPDGVPAFIASAPPSVPGMPREELGSPTRPSGVRPLDRARRWACRPEGRGAAGPASPRRGRAARRSTTPRTPRSATSVLAPPPRTWTGTPSSRAARRQATRSPGSAGRTSRSAGPPMRIEVRARERRVPDAPRRGAGRTARRASRARPRALSPPGASAALGRRW